MRGPVLSARLKRLSELVPRGLRLADIGTDHGFIPAALLLENRVPFAYACDVAPGPLKRAEEHLRACGVLDRARLCLSDGLAGLTPGEPESVLIAGMGGPLMREILTRALAVRNGKGEGFLDTVKEWILSPHTEAETVREFLMENGLRLVHEELLFDEGKRYLIMKVVPGDGEAPYREAEALGISQEEALLFGPLLLKKPLSPETEEFLRSEIRTCRAVLANLQRHGNETTEKTRAREAELSRRLGLLEHAAGKEVPGELT